MWVTILKNRRGDWHGALSVTRPADHPSFQAPACFRRRYTKVRENSGSPADVLLVFAFAFLIFRCSQASEAVLPR